MKLLYTSLLLTALSYVVLFLSIICQSSLLFWLGALSLVVLLLTYPLFCKSDSKTLFLILIFVTMIGYVLGIFYQFYYNGTLLPIADTNFSMQLVEILSDKGYLFPPQGSFRGISYSHYPVSFIFGSIFAQVTGLSPYLFAFFIYPLVNYFAILALLYMIARSLIRSRVGAYIAICVFALNAQLLFFYSFQVFHYEQIAWVFLLLTIYATLKSATEKNLVFVILASLSSFLCAASHHFTSYILLVCSLSFLMLIPYAVVHKKIFMKKGILKENLSRITKISLLISTIVIATKSFLTFPREGLTLSKVFSAILATLLGQSSSTGVIKFDPWNYNVSEISVILVGNIALFALTAFAFLFSLRHQAFRNRLTEIMALMIGASLFVLFQYSQFRGQEILRFFMPFTFVSGLLIGNFQSSLTSNSIKKTFFAFFICTLAVFFVAQLTFAKYHPISNVGREPVVFTKNVEASMNFILNNGQVRYDIIAYPLGYFEGLYAKFNITPKFHTETTVAAAIANDGGKLLHTADYLILYSPLDTQFISSFIEPELRDKWTFSVHELYLTSNKFYDNGRVIAFSEAKKLK